MSVLVSGNIAFDTILQIEGSFDACLSEAGVFAGGSFLAQASAHRRPGGSAGNIAHGLALLGVPARPAAVAGSDAGNYLLGLQRRGVDLSGIVIDAEEPTADCFLISDTTGRQLVTFNLNAAASSARHDLGDTTGVTTAVIAPSTTVAMSKHASVLSEQGVRMVVAPGHAVAQFGPDALRDLLRAASVMVLNERELSTVLDVTGLAPADFVDRHHAVLVTMAEQGSRVFTHGASPVHVRAYGVAGSVDPTGCGDAYLAGLVAGLVSGRDIAAAADVASRLAGLCAKHFGGQGYGQDPYEGEPLRRLLAGERASLHPAE